MNPALPSPNRKVSLRLSAPGQDLMPPALEAEALDELLARARALGFPLHHDAQVAAVLVALRLRADIPNELYAAAAAVLHCVYQAAEEG
ncbi:flagellar biosynthesis protein [Dyella subtropica]|uniref:flagellar biosynthesis protein n=1 Tax=Dyella subtropica TaxID=2992127 RepID=UPI002256DE8B|nr:flagellar biosynthesis protein [Dyella subtropica]